MSSGAAALRIDVVSLFPETVRAALAASIPARAVERGLAELKVHDLREWGLGSIAPWMMSRTVAAPGC